MSNSLQPHGLYSSWNSPGQNTGVGSLSLLQGNQGLNPGLLHWGQIIYRLTHKGSLFNLYAEYIMQNARLRETQAGIKIARININNLYMQMTPPLWQKVKKNPRAS